MKVGTFTKQPGEKISKSVLYTEALDDGDYIETVVSYVASPVGLTILAGLSSNDRVRVWFEGGTDGVTYKVTLKVSTHQGEVFEDEITCKVKEI